MVRSVWLSAKAPLYRGQNSPCPRRGREARAAIFEAKGGPVSICPKHMRNMLQILCRTPLPLTELAARLTVRGKVTNAHTELAMEE
jgi:hypothetical protein